MTSPRALHGILVACVAAAATGCGGSGDANDTIDLADAFASARVCNGEANENVPEGANGTAYTHLSNGDGWSTAWPGVFGDNEAIVGDDAGNILCVTVTASSEAQRCDYEDDGDAFTLIMMDATYDIELRFASSANVIGRDSGSATADDCPTVVSWTPGESERQQFPVPTEALQPLLDTFFS